MAHIEATTDPEICVCCPRCHSSWPEWRFDIAGILSFDEGRTVTFCASSCSNMRYCLPLTHPGCRVHLRPVILSVASTLKLQEQLAWRWSQSLSLIVMDYCYGLLDYCFRLNTQRCNWIIVFGLWHSYALSHCQFQLLWLFFVSIIHIRTYDCTSVHMSTCMTAFSLQDAFSLAITPWRPWSNRKADFLS